MHLKVKGGNYVGLVVEYLNLSLKTLIAVFASVERFSLSNLHFLSPRAQEQIVKYSRRKILEKVLPKVFGIVRNNRNLFDIMIRLQSCLYN